MRQLIAAAVAAGCAACGGDYSTLAPAGPHAAAVARLWWVMLAGATVIFAGVLATVAWAQLRRGTSRRTPSERLFLLGGGVVFPVVTLLALLVYALSTGEGLVARAGAGHVVVEAHARRWAWEFEYPDAPQGRARSVGVLHVPAGRPFEVHVSSPDVIHSFWVPRLGGKIDAIPGRVNAVRLQADAPGDYGGLCAEYCGVGHAYMRFTVRAHAPADYAAVLGSLPRARATRRSDFTPASAPLAPVGGVAPR